jgi:phage tail-like protein
VKGDAPLNDTAQYFSLRTAKDFEKGLLSRMIFSKTGLGIHPEYPEGPYVFYASPLDSLENGMPWQRAVVNAQIPPGAWIKISWLTSDNTIIKTSKGYQDFMDYLTGDLVSEEEKKQVVDPLYQRHAVNVPDFLLNAQGRYLFLRIEMFGLEGRRPSLNHMRVYFSVPSLLQYLPEIYGMHPESADFLNRYLSIFQSFWMDMEEQIRQAPRLFDPDVAPYPFLIWISSWIGAGYSQFWKEDKLRLLLKKIPLLYKIKGTRRSIGEIVELYTGEPCYIVEPHEIQDIIASLPDTGHLYEMNPFVFTVLVNEAQIPGEKERYELKRLIDDFKPAHTEAQLVILRSHIHLGSHSYLGVNSYLTQPGPFKLDGSAALELTVLGDHAKEEIAQ